MCIFGFYLKHEEGTYVGSQGMLTRLLLSKEVMDPQAPPLLFELTDYGSEYLIISYWGCIGGYSLSALS